MYQWLAFGDNWLIHLSLLTIAINDSAQARLPVGEPVNVSLVKSILLIFNMATAIV